MRALSVSQLLGVWEQATGKSPVEQSLALLKIACPETPAQDVLNWTIGQRDGALLTLREWTFGTQLNSLALCSACGEQLELAFETGAIRVATEGLNNETFTVSSEDHTVTLRLPVVGDLLLIQSATAEVARRVLLERCTLEIQCAGKAVTMSDWPEKLEAAAVAAMAQNDPQADIQLALHCPHCGHDWQANFDIVAYFWDEINAWAIRLLREVHVLAANYGWSETDILALSPTRRQLYLEMLCK